MLSAGVPMFRMGDEFLQTQGGNNNLHQDNETSWLDWSRLDENADIFRFFQHMIAFRKAHPRWPAPASGATMSAGTVSPGIRT